jgi:glycosyltransferase involved in cell wall biosynthesis
VPSNVDSISAGLQQMVSKSSEELDAMAQRAVGFVREKYDWNGICRDLEEVYSWLAGRSGMPQCVRAE